MKKCHIQSAFHFHNQIQTTLRFLPDQLLKYSKCITAKSKRRGGENKQNFSSSPNRFIPRDTYRRNWYPHWQNLRQCQTPESHWQVSLCETRRPLTSSTFTASQDRCVAERDVITRWRYSFPHSGEHATSLQLNTVSPVLMLRQASYSLPHTRHVFVCFGI